MDEIERVKVEGRKRRGAGMRVSRERLEEGFWRERGRRKRESKRLEKL